MNVKKTKSSKKIVLKTTMSMTSSICREDPVVHTLKCCHIGIGPWLCRIENLPHDDTDKPIAKIHADVGREILDAWENLLAFSEPWE